MNNEILDDEIIHPVSEKRMKLFWLEVLLSVIFMSFFYGLFHIFVMEKMQLFHYWLWHEITKSAPSILHLFMTMAFVNYNVCKGDYKMNVRSGCYVLLFGSGLFFIGSIWGAIEGIITMDYESIHHYAYINRYEIVTLGVIFIKCLLIIPFAKFLTKNTTTH